MSGRECRFAVGSPVGYRSSVWKAWVRKNDAYLASRAMGSDLKISFHGSGACQASGTSDWVRRQNERVRNTDRHFLRWHLRIAMPGEFMHAFRIIVPESELRVFDDASDLNTVSWLEPPRPTRAVALDLLLSSPDADEVRLEGEFFSMRLADGRWFVGIAREGPVLPLDREMLEDGRASVRRFWQDHKGSAASNFRGLVFVEDSEGPRGAIEVAPIPRTIEHLL